MELELMIRNQRRVLPSVHGFVRETLKLVPLPDSEMEPLALFLMQAVEHAIQTAYPEGEQGAIKLTFAETADRLEATVRDFGLPQDIQLLERQLLESDGKGLVLHGCHAADVADEVHWEAFGREGKALKLVKWLHNQPIGSHTELPDLSTGQEEVPPAAEQDYEIRRMRPDEAVQVSQLMYRTYGGTYFNEDVYFPERIAAQNAHGSLISAVAIDQEGQVVGHEAVERVSDGPVVELGQAAIDPRHRGRGLMSRMKALLVEEAAHLNLPGWFADAVAVHALTQKSNAHHDGHVSGVNLGIAPKTEAFRSIADELVQRVSCLVYFHWLKEPQKRFVHVPERHREIVSEIYENLQCPFELGQATTVAQGQGALRIKRVSGSASAFISVAHPGLDSGPAIKHALRELVEISHMEAVFVDLPLANPTTAGLWESLGSSGLGFVGIGPHFSTQGDVVRLVYLVEPLAREPIHTYEPFAGRLVDYVLAEQQRVRRNL